MPFTGKRIGEAKAWFCLNPDQTVTAIDITNIGPRPVQIMVNTSPTVPPTTRVDVPYYGLGVSITSAVTLASIYTLVTGPYHVWAISEEPVTLDVAYAATSTLPGNTGGVNLPVISGTPASGQTLTLSNGTWSGSPTFARRWLLNGVRIPGEVGNTYVVQVSDRGASIEGVVLATNASGTEFARSAAVNVTSPAPLAPPANSDLPAITGTAEVGQVLTRSLGTWSGASSHITQWIRGTSPMLGQGGATYTVQPGDENFTFRVAVTAVAADGSGTTVVSEPTLRVPDGVVSASGPPIATTLQSSVTHGLVTWNFDVPVLVGNFASGIPFVVSDRVANITSVTPNGTTVAAGAYWTNSLTTGQGNLIGAGLLYEANGMMENPYIEDAGGQQAFDGLLGVFLSGGGQNVATTPYSAGLQKDPTLAGQPFSITPGMATSLVKTVRRTGMTTPLVTWRHFEDMRVLHILPSAPPIGSVAPSASKLDKTIYTSAALRNPAALGPGFSYVSGQPTLATCISGGYFRAVQPFWVQSAQKRRRMMILDYNLNASGYSGGSDGFGLFWSDFMAAILTEGPAATASAVEAALTFGAELIGVLDRGYDQSGGAGQYSGHKQFAQFFGHYFKDVPGLMAKCLAISGNASKQQFWITSDMEGIATNWPGNHDRLFGTPTDRHIGRPAWAHTTSSFRPTPLSVIDVAPDADYQFTAGVATFAEMLNICLMKDGPGGQDGSQVITRGNGMSTSNPDAALVAYIDNYRTFPSGAFSLLPHLPRQIALYDARRNNASLPRWTGVPDSFTPTASVATFLVATANGFDWNLTTAGCATETVLEYAIQYSVDQKFWINVTTPAVSGSQTGLANRAYFVRWRMRSASGWGPWSVNYPFLVGGASRMVVTPTVGATNSVVATVSPGIYVAKYPQWAGVLNELAPSTLPGTTQEIQISFGDPGINGAVTRRFDLIVNGVTVMSNVTDFDTPISLLVAWAGQTIRADVTTTDGVTPSTVSTQTVTMAAVTGAPSIWRPRGTVGALPNGFTSRWITSSDLTYQASSIFDPRPVARLAQQVTLGNRFWSIDELVPIGSLADVPEGEVRAAVNYGNNAGSNGQFNQFVIRGTGAAGTENGYVLRFEGGAATRGLSMIRVVNGVRSNITMNLITGGTGTALYVPEPYGTIIGRARAKSSVRFDWRMVSTSLRIRAKFWWDSTDPDEYPSTEPANWQVEYTDASPLASGRMGFGLISTSENRDIFWMGIAKGPTDLAPFG